MTKTMTTSEIKSSRVQIEGKFAAFVKKENIDMTMHEFLNSLKFIFIGQGAYKHVKEENYKGIADYARRIIIFRINKNENRSLDFISSELGYPGTCTIEQVAEELEKVKDVEKLTRLLDIA